MKAHTPSTNEIRKTVAPDLPISAPRRVPPSHVGNPGRPGPGRRGPRPTPQPAPKPAPKAAIAPPKGTRDLYPEDALRRRYVQQAWRDASIRCGFDEIAGPTFETSDLYAVKSGEGILSELFQAYSGKAEEEIEQVKTTGRAPYALRPEFTPTLARMYAAKAGSLPKPCKWFTAGPYFRAERPQRGRLREFEQWNVDVIGLPGDVNAEAAESAEAKAWMDAECVECCVALLQAMGLSPKDTRVELNDRRGVAKSLLSIGIPEEKHDELFTLIDKSSKQGGEWLVAECRQRSFPLAIAVFFADASIERRSEPGEGFEASLRRLLDETGVEEVFQHLSNNWASSLVTQVFLQGTPAGIWTRPTPTIVRGLAYYTGTVFEVIAEGERAVAGGGRYDNLIELMGGPPTPAVGFAMGDVVLSLLLDDKGLMPSGADLMDAVSRPPASVRPEVFVLGADDDATDPLVRRLTADLRRGVESKRWSESDAKKLWARERYDSGLASDGGGVRPLHARLSYKSTRNLKKLLADAEKQHARLAALVHGADRVQLRDLDARRELTPADVPAMPAGAAEFSVNPQSDLYIGRAAAALLGV